MKMLSQARNTPQKLPQPHSARKVSPQVPAIKMDQAARMMALATPRGQATPRGHYTSRQVARVPMSARGVAGSSVANSSAHRGMSSPQGGYSPTAPQTARPHYNTATPRRPVSTNTNNGPPRSARRTSIPIYAGPIRTSTKPPIPVVSARGRVTTTPRVLPGTNATIETPMPGKISNQFVIPHTHTKLSFDSIQAR